MPWPPENNSKPKPDAGKQQKPPSSFNLSTSPPSAPRGWDSCLSITEWSDWVDPRTLIPTAVLTTSILLIFRINRRLRRFPDAVSISPPYFRGRSLFGQVTSVGDGDNFRFFHTPGGRLAGWGWLPWKKVPTSKKDLKDNTVRAYYLSALLYIYSPIHGQPMLTTSDPHPSSRHRRPRTPSLRSPRTTLRARSPRVANKLPHEPARARLRPPTRPIPTRCRQRVRPPSIRLSNAVPKTRRIVRDASARSRDRVRGEEWSRVRRGGEGTEV